MMTDREIVLLLRPSEAGYLADLLYLHGRGTLASEMSEYLYGERDRVLAKRLRESDERV